jgi:tetratricopeptide (TPR) repeat protein
MKLASRILGAAVIVALVASASPSFAVMGGGNYSGGGGSSSGSGVSLSDAEAYIERGRYRDAIAVLRQIIEAEPRNADALNMLGYSLRKSGNYRQAQGFYLKALQIKPGHRGANEYLGELYVEIGQIEKARERLEALEAICGTSCREYRLLKTAIDAAI